MINLRTGIIVAVALLSVFAIREYSIRSCMSSVQEPETGHQARILVISRRGAIGEKELVARMKRSAPKVGVQLSAVKAEPSLLARMFFYRPVEAAIQSSRPDLILTLQPEIPYYGGAVNYLWISKGLHSLQVVDHNKNPFDGFLIPSLESENSEKMVDALPVGAPLGSWFAAASETKYRSSRRSNVFYCGVNSDSRRTSAPIVGLLRDLHVSQRLRAYGPKAAWRGFEGSYQGYIASNGVDIIERIRDCGIALVLHSDVHLKEGCISGRIFEAAAAGAVIISDAHPFVREVFGDNVFYLDVGQSEAALVAQMDEIRSQIERHPLRAEEMARACHQIVTADYTLEQQITNLVSFHEGLSCAAGITPDS
jgi:hypothetical protein